MNIPDLAQYRDLLLRYLLPQKERAAMMAVLLLGSIGLQLYTPQLLRQFIDTAVVHGSGAQIDLNNLAQFPITADNTENRLLMIAVIFIIVALLQQIVSVIAVYFSENVGWTATNWMRQDLARHCLNLDMTFHHLRTPGEMIERVDSDVTQVANFFSQFVVMVLANLLLLLGVVIVVYAENVIVGIAMTIFALGTLWTLNRVRSLAIPAWAATQEARAQFYGFLEEQLSGTEDTRSSGAVSFVMRRFAYLRRIQLQAENKAAFMNSIIFSAVVLCVTLGTIAVFVLGYYLLQAGALTVGTVFLFVTYTNMLTRPMREITFQIQELQKAGAGIGRVNELMAITTNINDGPGKPIPTGPLHVSFDHVDFSYNPEDPLFEDFQLELEPGRVLGLLGRTGSGKTSVTRLLFRLYDINDGAIRLSGTDIRDATLQELRQRVGIVTQDVQLFRASIRDNLTFFNDNIPDERILEVIYDLDLGKWFDQQPEGLDTRMASGGTGLSAGEAQLVAFARVFLKDPGLVVLDEASSRLDPVTEQRIERAIDKLLHNRTAIIVAHRLVTVQRADEIMIIEDGRIKEHDDRVTLANDPDSHFYHLLQTGLEEALA